MTDFIGNFVGGAVQPATSGVHNLFQQYFHKKLTTWPSVSSGIQATGGTISTTGQYTYHAFTSSSSFVVSASNATATAEILVVGAGGAGAGGWGGAGGGGGGILYSTTYPIAPGTYPITIGSGASNSSQNTSGSPGTASVFNGYPAGGGAGGSGGGNPAGPGGASGPVTPAPAVGFIAYGPNPGGQRGGGGAGAPGTPTASGIGTQFPAFIDYGTAGPPADGSPPTAKGYFAGGGTSTATHPGQYGGGSNTPTPAVVNTGGGGGSQNDGYPNTSAPGIVLIRYIK